MRDSFSVLLFMIKDQFMKIQVCCGFLLGIIISFQPVMSLISYSQQVNGKIQILESFITLLSMRHNMAFLILGFLLCSSNAPFVTSGTVYALMRTTRKKWFHSSFVYIGFLAFSYIAILLLFSIILSSGVSFIKNEWSETVYYVARYVPEEAVKLSLGIELGPLIFENLTPLSASLYSSILFFLYCFFLGCVMCIGNSFKGKFYGWSVAVLIHGVGYILISDAWGSFPVLSPMAHALLNLHDIYKGNLSINSLPFSLAVFILLLILLYKIGNWFVKNFDFVISGGEKT